MSYEKTFFIVDAFTRHPFSGTPAAIIPDSDDLSENLMLQICRELNVNEAMFLSKAEDADVRARFYTPSHEVDLSGHAVLGVPYVVNFEQERSSWNIGEGGKKYSIMVKTNLRIFELQVEIKENKESKESKEGHYKKSMLYYNLPKFWKTSVDSATVAHYLGINETDIHPN
ncbi:MAG: PhzF family phenazine biosynthesis isomerase, partial [Thermoplasmata archaeon]